MSKDKTQAILDVLRKEASQTSKQASDSDVPKEGDSKITSAPGKKDPEMGAEGSATEDPKVVEETPAADKKQVDEREGAEGVTVKAADKIKKKAEAIMSIFKGKPETPAVTTSAAPASKSASGVAEEPVANFDEPTLAKIASQLLSTEKGMALYGEILDAQAGDQIKQAAIAQAQQEVAGYKQAEAAAQNETLQKQAAFEFGTNFVKEAAAQLDAIGITEDDAGMVLKTAADISKKNQEHGWTADWQKSASAMGGELAGAAMDGAEVPTQPSIEEVVMLIEQLVQSGELTEEQAVELVSELQAEEGAEAPAAPEAPMAAPAM